MYKNMGVLGKVFLLLFSTLFFSIMGMAIVSILFKGANDIHILKINQSILSIFTLFIPSFLVGYLWYERPFSAFSINRFPQFNQIFLSVLLIVLISPFINLLAHLNEQIVLPDFLSSLEEQFRATENRIKEISMQMLWADSFSIYLFNLFVMAMLPALGEELFCRGALMNVFAEKWSKHAAVWLVAIVFSLIHFQMYGFIPRMLLGAILGYLLLWSGSLWLPIIIHFINNGLIVTAFYIYGGEIDTLENLGREGTVVWGIVSGILSLFVLWLIYKLRPIRE